MKSATRCGLPALLLALGLSGCVAHAPLTRATDPDYSPEVGTDTVAAVVQAMRDVPGVASEEKAPTMLPDEVEPLEATRFELESADQKILGRVQVIRTRDDDTFSDIARTYGLGYDDLVHANPDVDPWLPGSGTPVVLPTQFVLPDAPREGIVLNIAAKRLFYFPAAEEGEVKVVITHPIGIGRVGWATPIGSGKIVSKAENPTWYVPASIRKEHREMGDPIPAVIPPGEDNPLGHRVLKLDMEGYLIHGTNQPYGVGMRVSHGCVRLYPENIETLYEAVGRGTRVHIVNEPMLGGWLDNSYYVQAHPLLEDDEVDLTSRVDTLIAQLQENDVADAEMFREKLTALGENARGYPVSVLSSGSDEPHISVPVSVKNIVVVDNPVSKEELAEIMVQSDNSSD